MGSRNFVWNLNGQFYLFFSIKQKNSSLLIFYKEAGTNPNVLESRKYAT